MSPTNPREKTQVRIVNETNLQMGTNISENDIDLVGELVFLQVVLPVMHTNHHSYYYTNTTITTSTSTLLMLL